MTGKHHINDRKSCQRREKVNRECAVFLFVIVCKYSLEACRTPTFLCISAIKKGDVLTVILKIVIKKTQRLSTCLPEQSNTHNLDEHSNKQSVIKSLLGKTFLFGSVHS